MKSLKDYMKENSQRIVRDEKITEYVYPKKILWVDGDVLNSDSLLLIKEGQATLEAENLCVIKNKGSFLLDFGFEMQGGIQITTHFTAATVRVRFGESAMEAMSNIGDGKGATNDHAIRDSSYKLSWLGNTNIGNTGFRFVRIDLEDGDELMIKSVRAAFTYRNLQYKGFFECNDADLNKIWQTAAYTVQLNMQDYVWDGVKRDRLVWIGDMHPEVSTIQYVFGNCSCVKNSLDLIKEKTPLPNVMNGIPAYSLWWVLIQRDWFLQNGDFSYLKKQEKYMISLVEFFSGFIGENGINNIDNNFLDWPSSTNPEGQKAGVHALFILAMNAAGEIFEALGNKRYSEFAFLCAKKLSAHVYPNNGSKQALALQVLAEQVNALEASKQLLENGVHGYSTFLGYYILKALGEAEKTTEALISIKAYWGKMIELGATTFWEDFDIDWAENCSKLDEILPENTTKKDIHGDFGGYCYRGYRHSLAHGWASGPAPFLMQYVLGVKPIKAGCQQVLIAPSLGDLTYVRGTYPTPYGIISVEHKKCEDGEIKTVVDAPDEIEIILG